MATNYTDGMNATLPRVLGLINPPNPPRQHLVVTLHYEHDAPANNNRVAFSINGNAGEVTWREDSPPTFSFRTTYLQFLETVLNDLARKHYPVLSSHKEIESERRWDATL